MATPLPAHRRYITNPLLINGRKFGLRLWALVPGAAPLRAYVHANGLALFSSEPYRPEGAHGLGSCVCACVMCVCVLTGCSSGVCP